MKMIGKYASLGVNSENEVFDYLLTHLKDTIRTHGFFVAWEKIFKNVSEIEISLNILNSLIGKEDIKDKFRELIIKYPEIVPVIPLLIAVRDKKLKIVDTHGDLEYSFIQCDTCSEAEIDKIVSFAEKCGLLKILADKNVKNLVDYSIGIEVGIDTNARKNRSGSEMEKLIEEYIKPICNKHNYSYLAQANVSHIHKEFGKKVKTDRSNRFFDFVINAKNKLYLIEVNYYGSGGSKLKSVAGEFKELYKLVTSDEVGFIWITDGLGWHTAKRPLRETFTAIDFIINIDMIKNGILESILTEGL